MVVELAGDDGHGDIYLIGNPLEVSPDARIPIGIRVVGVRNPVAVVIQPPAQDSDIRFNLGTVQIEGIVVLSDRLAVLAFRAADVFFCIVNDPSAHDIFPKQAGAEAGDVPVDPIVAQIQAFQFRDGIGDQPAGQGRIGCPEDSDGLAPRPVGQPPVQGDAVFPLVDVRAEETFGAAFAPAILLDIADSAAGIFSPQGIVVSAPSEYIRGTCHDHRPGTFSFWEIDPCQEMETIPAGYHFLPVYIGVGCRDGKQGSVIRLGLEGNAGGEGCPCNH